MSLRKRGSVWWIDIAPPSGERVRRSTETGNKAQAQELHDKLKSELWRLQKLGDRPRRIWQDAAVRWLREQAYKATMEDDKEKLRWLDRHLADRELESINRALIDAITEAKRAEGCSNATVNRTLALIRAILRKCARDWEWLDRAPAVRLLKEPTRRIRFLNQHQARTLLRELPAHLRDMATFTLATGLRAANVTGLTWEQVDLSRKHAWIHPDQAKARRAIALPLNDTALRVVREQRGKHPVRVFTYEGKPIRQVSTAAWYKALPRAGIGESAGTTFATRGRRGTSGGLRRQHGKSRHEYGTTTGLPRHSPIASGEKLSKFMVARDRIELPTRGFSVPVPKRAKSVTVLGN